MQKQSYSKSNNVGDRIRELRQKRNLTQGELGRLLNCGQTTVSEWERNKDRIPSKKFLAQVAQTLGVSLDYLLGEGNPENSKIPCIGKTCSESFNWSNLNGIDHYIEVPPNEYSANRFSLKILDDLLEPIVCKDDYCVFEKVFHIKDGDIVIVRFEKEANKAIIKKWRQQDKVVMLLDVNPHSISPPYCFEIDETKGVNDDITYKINGLEAKTLKTLRVEGKLVAVKRILKTVSNYPGVNYIFS